jgi:WD40 repeat protein
LITTGDDGSIFFWDPITYKMQHYFSEHLERMNDFLCDEKVMITSSGDATIRLWAFETTSKSKIARFELKPPKKAERKLKGNGFTKQF